MSAVKLLTSVMIASLVMTSLVEGACFTQPLSFDRAPGLQGAKPSLSLYCSYEGQKKELFTLWIDEASCMRCFCRPAGLQCCGLPPTQAQALCGASI